MYYVYHLLNFNRSPSILPQAYNLLLRNFFIVVRSVPHTSLPHLTSSSSRSRLLLPLVEPSASTSMSTDPIPSLCRRQIPFLIYVAGIYLPSLTFNL